MEFDTEQEVKVRGDLPSAKDIFQSLKISMALIKAHIRHYMEDRQFLSRCHYAGLSDEKARGFDPSPRDKIDRLYSDIEVILDTEEKRLRSGEIYNMLQVFDKLLNDFDKVRNLEEELRAITAISSYAEEIRKTAEEAELKLGLRIEAETMPIAVAETGPEEPNKPKSRLSSFGCLFRIFKNRPKKPLN